MKASVIKKEVTTIQEVLVLELTPEEAKILWDIAGYDSTIPRLLESKKGDYSCEQYEKLLRIIREKMPNQFR